MKNFTPEQYVLYQLQQYPTLYKGPTLAEVKLRVYDHFFNTIGNGIANLEDLQNQLTYKDDYNEALARKFITSEQLYYGYPEVEKHVVGSDVVIERGVGKWINCLESEKEFYPDIKRWTTASYHEFVPYPNFKRKYSLLYTIDYAFITLSKEWLEEAKWFYNQCGWWFAQECNAGKYSSAYPRQTDFAMQRDLNEWTQILSGETYKLDPVLIEKAYGIPFDGDVDTFLRKRWVEDLKRIAEFLGDVQTYLTYAIEHSVDQ